MKQSSQNLLKYISLLFIVRRKVNYSDEQATGPQKYSVGSACMLARHCLVLVRKSEEYFNNTAKKLHTIINSFIDV